MAKSIIKMTDRKCNVKHCTKKAWSRRLCPAHLERWRKGATLPAAPPEKIHAYPKGLLCKIEGCAKKARDNFMCQQHAQRVRKYGDPHKILTKEEWRLRCRNAQPMLGNVQHQTYKKYLGRHLHRIIMEEKLGRKLRRGEIVHHIDGNKHNNNPANLELLTQSEHIKLHRKEMNDARIARLSDRANRKSKKVLKNK